MPASVLTEQKSQHDRQNGFGFCRDARTSRGVAEATSNGGTAILGRFGQDLSTRAGGSNAQLASKITTSEIDQWYEWRSTPALTAASCAAQAAAAFLLFIVKPERQDGGMPGIELPADRSSRRA